MTAKVTDLKNPDYNPAGDILQNTVEEYHSEIFCLSALGGDNEKYKELMKKLTSQEFEHLIPLDASKSWTKTGDLMIHVEYVEMKKHDSLDPDEREY